MQLFRTLCVVAVLGALTYGAYVTLTGSPPVEPPLDAVNWSSPPHVDLPGGAALTTPSVPPAVAAPATSAAAESAPKFGGSARLNNPTDSLAGTPLRPTITGVRANSGDGDNPPLSYPSTGRAPGPFDTADSQPLASADPAADPSASPYPGTSLATVGESTAGGVTPAGGAAPLTMPHDNRSLIQPAVPTPTPTPTSKVPFAEIEALASSSPSKALEEASRYFDDPELSPDESRRVTELLDHLAGRVIYSREHLLEPAHTVQPGERLDTIAAKYNVSWELLAKINGYDPSSVPTPQPGTQLKVIRGPFAALVDRSRRQLSVFLVSGLYAGSFPIGFGRDNPPVDGQFTIGNKSPSGQPQRWLDLGNGTFVHAAADGAPLSDDNASGSIRLNPSDAADVGDILTVGSPVIVRQ